MISRSVSASSPSRSFQFADYLSAGSLKGCLAVSDVSGSMSGIPMEVAVGM